MSEREPNSEESGLPTSKGLEERSSGPFSFRGYAVSHVAVQGSIETNPDALMREALVALRARDFPVARALLRRAVATGHVDGALMEVALTANGSGGSADWAGALALLRAAAVDDPVALQQLALVGAMKLDPSGAPTSLPPAERLSDRPDIIRLRGFLSSDECAHIASTVQHMLQPSVVVDPATGRHVANPIRTSDEAMIGPTAEDLVIRAINRRIAQASSTNIDQGESLSILRYGPTQEFRLHHDAIGGVANQRIKTVLLYLNDGFAGGETLFPAAGLTIRPSAGDAIIFLNTTSDGRPDPAANHAGLPVRNGVKWLATRWIRARPIDPWNLAQTAS